MENEDIVHVLLNKPFSTFSYREKVSMKTTGRPLPKIQVTKPSGKTAAVNANWYAKYSWLTGTITNNRLYCWPCLLMGKSHTWSVNGFADIKNLDRATKRHDKCQDHVGAAIRLSLLGTMPIDQVVDEGVRLQIAHHNAKVRQNREVLKRLIDATAYLGMQELSFRGHDEGVDSDNRGNYRELAGVMARYDHVLAEHMQGSSFFTGMSKTIQNDLISAISSTIHKDITNDLDKAPFFSWQLNETTDISCHCQLSVMMRFVDDQGRIQARFMGFFDVSEGRDAQSLFQFVQAQLSSFNFVDKLVAQTYDGAAVMASDLNGLQAKVREVAPSATFVHCYAHRLNLVLSQGVRSIPQAKYFFVHLGGFTSFFSKSSKRVALLKDHGCARMPRSAPTRWNFTSRVVNTVASNYDKLVEIFDHFVDHPSMDDETIRLADGLRGKLEDFEFVFLLFTFEQLFSHTDVVFDILQHKSMDVSYCRLRIESLLRIVEELKLESTFVQIYQRAVAVDDPELFHRRKRRQGQSDLRQAYRRLYDSIHDSIITQITQRFQHLERLKFMELLNVDKFESFKSDFPTQSLLNLLETYGQFFDQDKLKIELLHFYRNPDINSSRKLCEAIGFMKSSGLDGAMPQLYKLMCLIATIGATSAGVEQSCSCLKRIKSYTRNTMGQERLKHLAMISIEKKILKSLQKNPAWYDQVTDIFATQTARRIDLIFK